MEEHVSDPKWTLGGSLNGAGRYNGFKTMFHPLRRDFIASGISDEERKKREAAWMKKHGYKSMWEVPPLKDKSDLDLRGEVEAFYEDIFVPEYIKYYEAKKAKEEAQKVLDDLNGNN
jgi:hypothetical protein